MNDIAIIDPMTEGEARAHVNAINAHVLDIGARLVDIRQREGWRALGYDCWTRFLEGEFAYSRKHLYELMRVAPVSEQLAGVLPKVTTLSVKALDTLSEYPYELRPAIALAAVNRYGEKPTPSEMRRAADILTEATHTGHVDTGNGTSTPIDAAFAEADYEAAQRQKQHIADKRGALVWRGEVVLNRTPFTGIFPANGGDFGDLWQLQQNGKKFIAVIYEVE